jgi:hypothetical protein
MQRGTLLDFSCPRGFRHAPFCHGTPGPRRPNCGRRASNGRAAGGWGAQ